MRIVRSTQASEEPMAPEHFEGAPSRRDLGPVETADGGALIVRFPAGARTHWHSHPNGQVLYVTAGRGRVGTRDGSVEALEPGDLVVAPADEQHWHGASDEAEVVHLALSFGDTEWFEPVTD